jgi:hypothetical protein
MLKDSSMIEIRLLNYAKSRAYQRNSGARGKFLFLARRFDVTLSHCTVVWTGTQTT